MTEQEEQALLANVKSLTDRMTMVDEVFRQAKLGRDMVPVFQCGHSGLYLPGDYIRGWGKDYGIGLGQHPVSECLDSDYDTAPPPITPEIRSIEQIMHPLHTTCAQVDMLLVERSAYEDDRLILAKEDPYLESRARLVRRKQLAHPKSRIRNMQAAWAALGRN